MNIHPDYVNSVQGAAEAIEKYSSGKNNVMAANEIIGGAISENNSDNVLVGKFYVEADIDGEIVRKPVRDLSAAIMIHMSWNTKGSKKIVHENITILEG